MTAQFDTTWNELADAWVASLDEELAGLLALCSGVAVATLVLAGILSLLGGGGDALTHLLLVTEGALVAGLIVFWAVTLIFCRTVLTGWSR